jgi:hypothetical protein
MDKGSIPTEVEGVQRGKTKKGIINIATNRKRNNEYPAATV